MFAIYVQSRQSLHFIEGVEKMWVKLTSSGKYGLAVDGLIIKSYDKRSDGTRDLHAIFDAVKREESVVEI